MFRFVVLLSALACAYASLGFGMDPATLGWRIVGGQEAADGAFPYQISLRRYGSHSCGGSILNENTILTAAHCVESVSPSSLTVVTGSNKLNQGGDKYAVSKTHVHPDWDRRNLVNDVAIVKLAQPIKFGPKVQAIQLEESVVAGDESCTLSGWGTTSYPGSVPNNLQFIELRTTSVEQCKKAHSGLPVYDSEICTLTKAGQGACHGDSGGPLARNGKQIGIVSWGRPCALGYPDVFTRVSSFASWIKNLM